MNITCDFYKSREKGTVNPKLFSDTADQYSKQLYDSGRGRANKRTQIRRFYDEVLRLNAATKENSQDWENILPYVNMLIAKAAYAQGRGLVTTDFVDMLRDCVRQIEQPQDLDVFSSFFEAFMGFYRQHGN